MIPLHEKKEVMCSHQASSPESALSLHAATWLQFSAGGILGFINFYTPNSSKYSPVSMLSLYTSATLQDSV